MTQRTKQNLIVVVIGICLFAALMNLSAVLSFGSKVIQIFLPLIIGGILALFINVPTTGIKNLLYKLFSKFKRTPSDKILHIIGFIISILCIAIVLTLVFVLLVPEVVQTSKTLWTTLEVRIPEWIALLDKYNINSSWIKEELNKIDFKQLAQNSSEQLGSLVGGVASTISSAVSSTITFVFGFIVAIYLVLDKSRVCRHSKKLLFAYTPKSYAEKISLFCTKFAKSFRKFLTGQCTEACILGTLMAIAFLIFKIPYAGLAGVLTAVCAIIPYVGAFISFGVCVFLTVLIDPMLGLKCAIVYLVVQFVENQFIYPKVVGTSVGLPPIYTLISALIGGKLFGIMGILFFIPIAAVVFDIVSENADKKLHIQHIKIQRKGD